ncbi:alpha/beta hydrolase [Nitrosomonas sp. H1_AOB3]|uniref:alpha/beta hydrolase n=1 Tax=Nitrosomonas sp. H1_AOB3 TaxID=2741553 RepID=UPI001936D98F|nr:alpha/beta hydrolase [Nitrosomonas sp. H1_AOB3]QOJ09411.1 MAG: alpha/beta hydrolase [Nitrosomonas sp. H1_AOB3]
MSSKVTQEFEESGRSVGLVVLLHAYTLSPESLIYVRNIVRTTLPDADIFTPHLPASTFSLANPVAVVCDLMDKIDAYWDKQKYENIIIVGHSLGALLGRKLYIYACGETPEAPFEVGVHNRIKRDWAEKVDRIILLAGMNRGWSISHHMSIPKAITFTLGAALGEVITWIKKRRPLILSIRRGAPFLTNLRIQWLAMRRATLSSRAGHAITIQLLGSIDDCVGPEDNIDLVSGADFVYIDVGKSGHANIIDMDTSTVGQERKQKFILALTANRQVLDNHCVLPQDTELLTKRTDVTDVIFVMHGIRDLGYWTHKIARRVKSLGKVNHRVFETETSSYGYFPMLSFLFPWRRRAKVEWLMDQYAEGLAQYPNATFSYIGHSHGTYLLAKALKDYPCCRFKHVVFAGSVVRTDYDWSNHLKTGRVKGILNYVATADWVVAWFPNALQMLGFQDLGSAGHRGFDSDKPNQIRYVKGAHSAALNEDNWDAIASFVIYGTPVNPPNKIIESKQAVWVSLPSRVAPLIWLGMALFLLWLGSMLLPGLTPDQWKKTLIFLFYLYGIYLALTKL